MIGDAEEAADLAKQVREQIGDKKKLSGGSTLGQLVRQKMKELNADLSGEYIDKVGKHFEMSVEGEGYTVKYGGGAKSINVDREQAARLTGHCRKLEAPAKVEEPAAAPGIKHLTK